MFTSNNKSVSIFNKEIWFKRWIIDKDTFEKIAIESGYSKSTLQRYFSVMLSKAPVLEFSTSDNVYLVIDGTYFPNDICLVVYRNYHLKSTQLYRMSDGEHFQEIAEDLQNILNIGIKIKSITSDGDKSCVKAIKKVCPNVPFQRCLVHISRMCRIWLTTKPKHKSGFELKQIVVKIHYINTEHKKQIWLMELIKWEETYRDFINQKSYNREKGGYWYTHRMIRRSFTVIKKALPNMFLYLKDDKIPNSTNSLESFFGHLKGNLNIHRGLSLKNRKNFLKWYLYYNTV
ncbi:transposase [Flavobacterium columnare]|uniref:transposase n=1 Tax=Flavobacterium columnare TaxID=996 RepID=UPI001F0C498E|nr:transposase [Flavobacterium columnare]